MKPQTDPANSNRGNRGLQLSEGDIALLETILGSFEPLSMIFESKAIQYPDPGEFEEQFINSLYNALTDFHKQLLSATSSIRTRNADLWKTAFEVLSKLSNSEYFVSTISEARSLKRVIDEGRELTPKEDKWMIRMVSRLPQLAHELASIVQLLKTTKDEWTQETNQETIESHVSYSGRR